MSNSLIAPHGGTLVNLLASAARAAELREASSLWPSWNLTPRQLCDLELLLNGGFSPLRGFMTTKDYESVCRDMRLADGTAWPIPIVLDLTDDFARQLEPGRAVVLRDPEGSMLAVLHVEELWQPDRLAEAEAVYGTTTREHPGVAALLGHTHAWFAGGRVEGLQLPVHYDFRALRQTPAETRAAFERLGWTRIVAFQTRNPLHRAHVELTLQAAREADAHLLIHPSVGLTKPGDIDHYTRVRCYQAALGRYPANLARLALLPLAMRMAGPREAVWHAIIRKNYGCTHLIVGRDHAGPGSDSSGRPFYEPYAAQELAQAQQAAVGVQIAPFRAMAYVETVDEYMPEDAVPRGARVLNLSGTEFRRRLSRGEAIPGWFTFPEIVEELQLRHPPRARQGFTVFFTGLSGSGKSTIANVLLVKLLERGGRPITLLDGDLVRKHLSSELGFSKAHRELNIQRIAYVASEITKNGGIAICAPIAPYDRIRRDARSLIAPLGGFVLVYVSTALDVCERRDRKGLYAKARKGLVENFTGISDPFEPPEDAEIVIDTALVSPEEAADRILERLEREGYLSAALEGQQLAGVAVG